MATQQDLMGIFDQAVLEKLRKAAVNKREQILDISSSTSQEDMAARTEAVMGTGGSVTTVVAWSCA